MACDRDLANGCARSPHETVNAANAAGWARQNVDVSENASGNESVANVSDDDAMDAEGREGGIIWRQCEVLVRRLGRTSLLRRSRSSGSQ
jgi:hypothetical protein